jgi:putative tricarboxylic transport membrane protein
MSVDRVLGAGAVLLAVLVGAVAWGFGVGTPKSPGAGFWPLLIVTAMGGLGVELLLRPGRAVAPAGTGKPRWGRFAIALGSLVFYVVSLGPLGYLLATAVLLFVQLRWVESVSWRLSVVIAVLSALLSLVIFRTLLKIPLPVGLVPLPKGW